MKTTVAHCDLHLPGPGYYVATLAVSDGDLVVDKHGGQVICAVNAGDEGAFELDVEVGLLGVLPGVLAKPFLMTQNVTVGAV